MTPKQIIQYTRAYNLLMHTILYSYKLLPIQF